jgi:hypothetical protein
VGPRAQQETVFFSIFGFNLLSFVTTPGLWGTKVQCTQTQRLQYVQTNNTYKILS